MRKILSTFLLLLAVVTPLFHPINAVEISQSITVQWLNRLLDNDKHQWVLIWADEFEGDRLDTNKWQIANTCHPSKLEGNCHSSSTDNVIVNNGHLTLAATQHALGHQFAQVRTLPDVNWQYGRIEVRARMPEGQGSWPSILLLPEIESYGEWPQSGEISIVEAVNLRTQTDALGIPKYEPEIRVYSGLKFYDSLNHPRTLQQNFMFGDETDASDAVSDFHVYSIEWTPHEIRWYIDDYHYATRTSDEWNTPEYRSRATDLILRDNYAAPFNQPFFLLIDVMLGGYKAEAANETGVDASIKRSRLFIDYVRVYECRSAVDDNLCESP